MIGIPFPMRIVEIDRYAAPPEKVRWLLLIQIHMTEIVHKKRTAILE